MSANPAFERLLKRDRAVTVAALALLCTLTWVYIAAGAGLGMPAWDMTTLALLPHQAGAQPMPGMEMPFMDMDMDIAMSGEAWDPAQWALVIGMWWAMMVAMMTPSAAPTILLYARVLRHAAAAGGPLANDIPTARARTGLFAAGYFLAWLAFSVVAATLQQVLQQTGVLSSMTMGSRIGWLSGTVLVVAGLYQLSPWKNACLSRCRAPAAFLARHWRPGATGALRLGLLHGAWCVGCCWMLMALLFVGGVMNLVWIVALSVLVLAEKHLPGGRWLGLGAGIVLVAWGLVVLLAVLPA